MPRRHETSRWRPYRCPSGRPCSRSWCTLPQSSLPRSVESAIQEVPDLGPAVNGLFGAICGGLVVIEETMSRTVVPVKLVLLATTLQLFLVLVDLIGRRCAVVVAEDSQQRCRQV